MPAFFDITLQGVYKDWCHSLCRLFLREQKETLDSYNIFK